MAKTVLIVEENSTDRSTLKGFLKQDYEVISSISGDRMLSVLRQKGQNISAILLNLALTKTDKFDFLQKYHKNALLRTIPFIIISDKSDEKIQEHALYLGAAGFISKPYNKGIILALLENIIRLGESRNLARACDLEYSHKQESALEKEQILGQLATDPKGEDKAEASIKVEAVQKQMETLLNNTPIGLAVIEINPNDLGTLHTIYYNDRFFSYSGYSRKEYEMILRDNETAFVFTEDLPILMKDTQTICSGEIGSCAESLVRCHTKGKSFRWLLLTGQLISRRGDICVINISLIDVTQRKEAQDAQRISEEMLRIAAETDERSMIVYDVKKNTCRAESRTLFSARYGDTFENIPQSLINIGLTAPESEDELCSLFARIKEGEKKVRVSLLLHCGLNKYEWFECNASTFFDSDGLPDHAILVFHNITEQLLKEAVFKKWQQSIEARPPESYTLFRCNLSKDASLDERDGNLLKVSFSATAMSFNSRTKTYADDYVFPDDREEYVKLLNSDYLLLMFYRGERSASLDYRETTKNGDTTWRRLTIEMVEYPNSTDVQAFLMYEDIDEKKKAEIEALEYAKIDPLTGALNRTAFSEAVDKIICDNPNSPCAILMLDMDGFKQLNDTFGHAAGDQALQEVVAVLRSCSRNGDLVCRLGGDEFMVFLRDVPYDAVISKTAQLMCEHIRKAYSKEILLSASVGIAVYPRDGQCYDELYPNADKALYKVKQAGKGTHAFFSAIEENITTEITQSLSNVKHISDSSQIKKRRMLIVDDNEVNRMVLKNIFKDEYLVEIAKNGAEALVRLRHFGASTSVVLLDLIMPGIDGFEVLKRMQSNIDLRTIPVVVVTSDENHETLIKAFDLGAAEYVIKPVDVDIIRMRVKAVIGKAENERLRAQNSYLMLQRDEEVKYHTVLESTGTAVVEHDWRNHLFTYDKEISKHIAGKFDHRGLWQIFLSDMVTDSIEVKILQDTLINLACDRKKERDSKLVMLKTPEGTKHWFRVNFYKSVDEFGLAEKLIITFNDVHEEVLANEKLLFQATRDELTRLYNRASFLEKAAELIAKEKPGYYVMSCIDVEKFKIINDRYGTDKGDEVLKHIADSVGGFAKQNQGICCRYSADKFAVIYPAKLLGTEELMENHNLAASPSCIPQTLRLYVGRCLVNEISLPVSAIFDRAAMAGAKAKGRYDTYIVEYDESMRDDILKEQQIVGSMVEALVNGEFEPWFQPQYNHDTGALIGAEALVRWRKDGKIIPPNEFIPIFEKNGFIYEVDHSIWRQVCSLLREWLDQGKNPLPISVNISRYDMLQENFLEVITQLVAEYRLPVELLRLEITESAFSSDTTKITDITGKLIAAGFTVEIDDFGSGYSSLNTLKDVPASILKLDMRFFERTGDAKRGGNIVESVVRMAKWLGMAVIAEGVEDKAQADYLKSIGCFYIQGYYYSKPLPVGEYEKRLNTSSKEAQLKYLQTLQNLDNNDFWDSHSMDTLVFNSYVGAACILELCNEKVEMLRATDHYVQMLCGKSLDIKDILAIDWTAHMDSKNISIFSSAVTESLEKKETVVRELEFYDLPNCPKKVILRSSMRVIAVVGERMLIYCLSDNITAQRAAERDALIISERIAAVMDNSQCGISAAIPHEDGSVELIFVNNRFFEILGYTREQYMTEVKSPYDRVVAEDRERVFKSVTKLIDVGSRLSEEVRQTRRDGSIVWLRCDASMVKFASIPEAVQVSSFLDITEQKENELKQLESARRLEIIMSSINGGVSAIQVLEDKTVKVVFNNDKYYELYGYTGQEALACGLNVWESIFPEDLQKVFSEVRQMRKDRKPHIIDYRIKKKDGSYAMLRANTSLMSVSGYGDDVLTSVITDITERKSLEERLNAIIDNINGGISAVYMKKDGIEFALANTQYYKILGYTKDEFETEKVNPFDLVHPEDRERIIKSFSENQRCGMNYTMEYRIVRKDGEVRHILCNTSVLQLFGIEEPLQLAVSNDITELRVAQQQELAMQNRLNTVMDTMSNAITAVAFHDNGLEVLFINNRFYEIHGISRGVSKEEGLAAAIDLVLPEFLPMVHRSFTEAENTWKTITYECKIRRPDGVVRWLRTSINMTRLVDVDYPVRVAVFSDITEEKEASEQLLFLNESAGEILSQSNTDKAINKTLQRLLSYFAGERAYVFELNERSQTSDNTYEICAEGITSEMARLQSVPYATQQCWFDVFEKEGFVAIPDVEAGSGICENQTRDLLLAQNIRSIIVAPLWRDDKLIGYIGVDNPTNAVEQTSRLIAVSDYIAVLLTRRDLIKSVEHGRKMAQQLMDDTPGGFLRLKIAADNSMEIVSLNVGFCRLLGMTADEVMAQYKTDARKYLLSEDIPTVKNAIASALDGNGIYTYKCRLIRKDGTIVWVQVFGRFVKDENGDLFRNSYFTDITEKQTAEENQIALLDNLPFGVAMYDYDGKKLTAIHINKSYWKLVKRDGIGTIIGALHPDDRGMIIKEIEDSIKEKRNPVADCRILGGEGTYLPFHVEGTITPKDNGHWMLCLAYSLIDQNKLSVQDMLPVALSTMMATSEDISYIKGKDLRYIACSQALANLVGYAETSLIVGKNAYDLFERSVADRLTKDDRKIIDTGEPVIDMIENITATDGSTCIVKTSKYPIRDLYGNAVGIYCTSHDVTAQRRQESQLNFLLRTIPGGVVNFRCCECNVEAKYYNDGVCALAGYTREEFDGHPVSLMSLVFEEDKPIITQQLVQMQNGEKSFNFVVRIHTKDGGYKWISGVSTVTDQVGKVYSVNAVLTDVTAQQEEKERLRYAEEEYRIATEHSLRTICRYNIAEMTLKVSHEASVRLSLPCVIQGVPYEQSKNGSVSPDTVNNYIAFFEKIIQGEKGGSCVFCKMLNKKWRWLNARFTTVFDRSGKPISAIISFSDITEAQEKELIYKKWEQSLAERKSKQFTLYRCNLNKDASYDTKEGDLFHFSVENKDKKSFDQCTFEFCNTFVVEDDQSKYSAFLRSDRLIAGYYRGVKSGEMIFRAKLCEDDIRWIRLTLELLEYPDSTDIEAYLMYEDINDSVIEELHIKKMAETDSLTGLQNRKIFIERVNSLLSQRSNDGCSALFLLDIDYFKHINDTFGHGVGDESIIKMAEVILSVINDDGFVCRLGGDEFLVYLHNIRSKDSVAEKARALCEAAHITIKNDIHISVSIGIASVANEGDSFDSMYHKADKALYFVKGRGKNNFAFYDSDMDRTDSEVMSDALCASSISLQNDKKTMVVVDDSAINRVVTAGLFKKDFIVFEAENGKVALEYLYNHSNEVAIVLLDILMPVMDGYELLAIMKADPILQTIPVIVISGEDDRKASLRAIQAGASEYMVKPVDVELLRLRISSTLSKVENESLRIKNKSFEVDSQELHSYRSLMDSNATVLVEYNARNGVFKYAPKTSDYLCGIFDARPIWQIFTEDSIASDIDAETIRKMIIDSEKPCKSTFDLMTPDGTAHPFLIKMIERDANAEDGIILITLTDRKQR